MSKDKRRPAKVAGIESFGNRTFRVRARVKDPRTRRMLERDRVIDNATIHEAIQLKAQLMEEMRQGKSAARGGKRTLGDYATSWLRGQWSSLCPSTRERYTRALDDHILPVLGELALDAVRPEDIETWRDDKKREGSASASVNGYLRILKTIVRKATRTERLPYDPALDVKSLPEDDTRITDEEPNALDEDELGRFLAAAKEFQPRHYPMILVLLTTGMRLSAARALRWEDCDTTRGVIVVRRRASGAEVVPGVKRSRKGRDIVPLLPELWATLQAHRETLNEKQHASGWVFPTKDGELHASTILRDPFIAIAKKAGIEKRFTPHGCRRTANDLYRRVSSEVVTRAITGHMTSAMHEHYSTVSPAEKLSAARRAFAVIVGSGGSSGGSEEQREEVSSKSAI